MKVSDKMTNKVQITSPDDTIQQAARTMAGCDAGALPVGTGDHLIGMITDRDIAVRGVAQGKAPNVKVREVMTQEVRYCFEDEDLDHVAANMADQQVRRLPVVNREKKLVGILSIGDIGPRLAGKAMSRPGGLHSQTGFTSRHTASTAA